MPLFGRETEKSEQRAQDWARWLNVQNPFAIASLVLGVFSLIEFGVLIVFGVAGIVLGAIALKQISSGTQSPRSQGRALAWSGIVTSILSLIAASLLYLGVFDAPRPG